MEFQRGFRSSAARTTTSASFAPPLPTSASDHGSIRHWRARGSQPALEAEAASPSHRGPGLAHAANLVCLGRVAVVPSMREGDLRVALAAREGDPLLVHGLREAAFRAGIERDLAVAGEASVHD